MNWSRPIPKLTINPLASGFRSSNKLNENFEAIETAFDNTLSRDGTVPNFMLADIDMNDNPIINLGAPTSPNDAARLIDVGGSYISVNVARYVPPSIFKEIQNRTWTGDVTQYIQSAIDALPTTGGTVFIPRGLWPVANILMQGTSGSKNATELFGEGRSTELKLLADTRANIINMRNNNHVVSDLFLNGNRANQSTIPPVPTDPDYESWNGVYAPGSVACTVRECYIENVALIGVVPGNPYHAISSGSDNIKIIGNHFYNNGSGIAAMDGRDIIVSDNTIIGFGGTLGYGVYPDQGSKNWTITGNTIRNYGQVGVFIYSNDDTTVTGNTIGECRVGIALQNFAKFNTISNNVITDSIGSGIFAQDNCQDNIISSNTITGASQYGVGLYGTPKNTVADNIISGCDFSGIAVLTDGVTYTSHHSTISNNRITDSGGSGLYIDGSDYNQIIGNQVLNSGATWSGIHLNNASHNMIIDNVAYDDRTPKLQVYGIKTEGTSSYNRIVGNDLTGNLTGPMTPQLSGDIITGNTTSIIGEQYVTPEMFGAKGDGIANDTAAFASTVSSIPPGGSIKLRAGSTYLVDQIVLPDKFSGFTRCEIFSDGVATIKKRSSANTSYLVADERYIVNSVFAISPWNFSNIVFDGNGLCDTTFVHRSYFSRFTNCTYLGGLNEQFVFTRLGIDLTTPISGSYLSNNIWTGCHFGGGTTSTFKTIGNPTDGWFVNCAFDGGSTAQYAMDLSHTAGWIIIANHTYGATVKDVYLRTINHTCDFSSNQLEGGLLIGSVGSEGGVEKIIGPNNDFWLPVQVDFTADGSDETVVLFGNKFSEFSGTDAYILHNNNSASKTIVSVSNVFKTTTPHRYAVGNTLGVYNLINGRAGNTNIGHSSLQVFRTGNNTGAAFLGLQKARGNYETKTAVAQNDQLGTVDYLGYGGSAYKTAVRLLGYTVATTPSDTDMQGQLSVDITPSGSVTPSNIMSLSHSTGLTMFNGNVIVDPNRHLVLRSYTVATLPSASPAAMMIYVSDGTTNKRLAISDGTNWRWPDGVIVS